MIRGLFIYQILILVFCLALSIRTFVLFLRHKKSIRELLLAILIWGSIALVGLFPNLTNLIADLTGFQLGINAILVFSILFLTFLVLKLVLKNDKIENSITRLVRQEALEELKKDQESKN